MSPHVGNFVADLVEMAKATEELPKVQAELRQLHDDNDTLAKSLLAREEAILRYKAEIEELHAKVRATEVARDDAEFRFLEAEEHAAKATTLARNAASILGDLIPVLDPPKPQPEPIPEVVHSVEEVASQGQSEQGPTSGTAQSITASVPAQETGANTSEPISMPEPRSGPYTNKRYTDHPAYVSREDWLAGGGTEADYDWREPSQRSSSW